MNFLNNIAEEKIKAFFAFMVLASCIGGFFAGLVPVEFFTGIVGLIISHYFENQKTRIVLNQLDTANAEIQQVRSQNAEILAFKENGKKEV